MYSFSEAGGYSFTSSTTTETYQQSSQTTTTTELQWEFTSNGYAKVQASDLLFENDAAPVKAQPQLHEQESEHQKCQTWYVPCKPVEKPSNSQEYLAPHKRYAGYDNKNVRSNIRGHTISSSGDSSQYAPSRSQSRQRQHIQVPNHQRSTSRSSYHAYPAPTVSRERAQRRPPLMKVHNLTRTKRTSTRDHVNSERRAAPTNQFSEVRKVRGKWIKGCVEAKSDSRPKICFQFLNHGTCSFGDRCRFEHVAKKVNRRVRRRAPVSSSGNTTSRTSFVSPNRFNFDQIKGSDW